MGIRRTAAQVFKGLIDEDDAKALNAAFLAQREQARLELAALPAQQVPPTPDEIDPERFRAEVLRARDGAVLVVAMRVMPLQWLLAGCG
jgi:hypothetical protein